MTWDGHQRKKRHADLCVKAVSNASRPNSLNKFADPECKFFGMHRAFKAVNHRASPLRSAPALNRKSLFKGYCMADDDQVVLRVLVQTCSGVSGAVRDDDIAADRFKEHATAFEQVYVLAIAKDPGLARD